MMDDNKTKDTDLIYIAGKIAYDKTINKGNVTEVNGVRYEALDVIETPSGMNAMTLKNKKSNEIVIAYQGTNTSDMKDILTDLSLGGNEVTAQLKEADEYYKQISGTYGKISYVCGNSLGGGLANYVAVNHKNVQSVTYNPAILPNGVKYDNVNNIRNYLGKYDPLTMLEIAAGYGSNIPGKKILTNINIPSLNFLVTNHVGYNNQNEIILKGRNTPIRIDVDTQLPLSVFTNDVLLNSLFNFTKKIKVDQFALESMSKGVERIRGNIGYAQSYLSEAYNIILSEGNVFDTRLEELKGKNDELLQHMGLYFLFDGQIKDSILGVNPAISIMKSTVKKINGIPIIVELIDFAVSLNPITNFASLLVEAEILVDELVASYNQIKRVSIPLLFKDTEHIFDDGLPEKLKIHFEMINENKNIINKKLIIYQEQTNAVWNIMKEVDSLGVKASDVSTASIPIMDTTQMKENKNFENIMVEKNKQIENNFNNFKKDVHTQLDQTILSLYTVCRRIENAGEDLLSLAKNIEWVMKYADVPIVQWDDQIIDDLYIKSKEARIKLEEYLVILSGIINILKSGKDNLEEVLVAMKPYIKNAIFSNSGYNDVTVYSLAATNIYESSSSSFYDINYQLKENKSTGVDVLAINAKDLENDMNMLISQIKKGTIY